MPLPLPVRGQARVTPPQAREQRHADPLPEAARMPIPQLNLGHTLPLPQLILLVTPLAAVAAR
jgi:hypothetical protein